MKRAFITTVALSALALTGCSTLTNSQVGTDPASEAVVEVAPEINHNPLDRSGDYFTDLGTSELPDICPTSGFAYEGRIDATGRLGSACGVVTKEIVDDRKGHSERWSKASRPLGMQDVTNEKVDIPKDATGKDKYHGYFYNQSHLIADSLGGDWTYENNIAGTRPQNVGNDRGKGHGGMRYPESIATDYINANPTCPITYSATPVYDTDEIVPRAVVVNMKSCDGALDKKIVTYNDALGFTIDYTTGQYTKN